MAMSKNVPPIKIGWDKGYNAALCRFLSDCKEDGIGLNIPFDKLIDKIQKYGRTHTYAGVKEYDYLSLYDNEAMNIIRALTAHMVLLYNELEEYRGNNDQ